MTTETFLTRLKEKQLLNRIEALERSVKELEAMPVSKPVYQQSYPPIRYDVTFKPVGDGYPWY